MRRQRWIPRTTVDHLVDINSATVVDALRAEWEFQTARYFSFALDVVLPTGEVRHHQCGGRCVVPVMDPDNPQAIHTLEREQARLRDILARIVETAHHNPDCLACAEVRRLTREGLCPRYSAHDDWAV